MIQHIKKILRKHKCQDFPLRGHRESTKNHPEVEKVVLPIHEIL